MSTEGKTLMTTAKALLGPKEVCKMIPGMTTAKLAQLRFKGQGPKFYKPTPKTVVYAEDELLAWLESTAKTGTAEVPR